MNAESAPAKSAGFARWPKARRSPTGGTLGQLVAGWPVAGDRLSKVARADQEDLYGLGSGGRRPEPSSPLEGTRGASNQLGIRLPLENLHHARAAKTQPAGEAIQQLITQASGTELICGRGSGRVGCHVGEDGIGLAAQMRRNLGIEDVSLDQSHVFRQAMRRDRLDIYSQNRPPWSDPGSSDLKP